MGPESTGAGGGEDHAPQGLAEPEDLGLAVGGVELQHQPGPGQARCGGKRAVVLEEPRSAKLRKLHDQVVESGKVHIAGVGSRFRAPVGRSSARYAQCGRRPGSARASGRPAGGSESGGSEITWVSWNSAARAWTAGVARVKTKGCPSSDAKNVPGLPGTGLPMLSRPVSDEGEDELRGLGRLIGSARLRALRNPGDDDGGLVETEELAVAQRLGREFLGAEVGEQGQNLGDRAGVGGGLGGLEHPPPVGSLRGSIGLEYGGLALPDQAQPGHAGRTDRQDAAIAEGVLVPGQDVEQRIGQGQDDVVAFDLAVNSLLQPVMTADAERKRRCLARRARRWLLLRRSFQVIWWIARP